MKLRNKKTGEIMDDAQYRNYSLSDGFGFRMNGKEWEYHSLAELNKEWEDYEEEEEEEYWSIDWTPELGVYHFTFCNSDYDKQLKQIGNYFETEEEAEKALEKLKAWKRLKDNGLKITGYRKSAYDTESTYHIDINIPLDYATSVEDKEDLDLLFGGEE